MLLHLESCWPWRGGPSLDQAVPGDSKGPPWKCTYLPCINQLIQSPNHKYSQSYHLSGSHSPSDYAPPSSPSPGTIQLETALCILQSLMKLFKLATSVICTKMYFLLTPLHILPNASILSYIKTLCLWPPIGHNYFPWISRRTSLSWATTCLFTFQKHTIINSSWH